MRQPFRMASYAEFWVTRRSGGVVCRHVDDLDAVLEFDTCDDLRQLICAFQPRQVFDAALSNLNTINLAVVDDNEPFVRTVLWRTVANTLSMGLVVRK